MSVAAEVAKLEAEQFYLNGFRAGVLAQELPPGSHEEFAHGFESGAKERAAIWKAATEEGGRPWPRPVEVPIGLGARWGDLTPAQQASLPVGTVLRIGDPSADLHKQRDGVWAGVNGECTSVPVPGRVILHLPGLALEQAQKEEAANVTRALLGEPEVGGEPPKAEIGMTYLYGGMYTGMVTCEPWEWQADVSEVRGPWHNRPVWRRG